MAAGRPGPWSIRCVRCVRLALHGPLSPPPMRISSHGPCATGVLPSRSPSRGDRHQLRSKNMARCGGKGGGKGGGMDSGMGGCGMGVCGTGKKKPAKKAKKAGKKKAKKA